MNTPRSNRVDHPHAHLARGMVGIAVLGILLVAALPLGAQETKDSGKSESEMNRHSAGFIASQEASAKDIGLPLYPGARQHKDKSDDSSAVRLGLWGGNSGFKLAVLKLESNDAPEKVAKFYRKALEKYGKVLDCRNPSKAASENKKGGSSSELTCEDEQPKSGEVVLKAGTKEQEHLVGVQEEGGLTVFQLVYVETRGSAGQK